MSALAPDVGPFLAGRLIQGLGSGWISGFAMVAIALLFPERHLARVFAAVTFVWGIATVLGPLFGGAVLQAGDLARRLLAVRRPGRRVQRGRAVPAERGGQGRRRAGHSLDRSWACWALGVAAIAVADVVRRRASPSAWWRLGLRCWAW